MQLVLGYSRHWGRDDWLYLSRLAEVPTARWMPSVLDGSGLRGYYRSETPETWTPPRRRRDRELVRVIKRDSFNPRKPVGFTVSEDLDERLRASGTNLSATIRTALIAGLSRVMPGADPALPGGQGRMLQVILPRELVDKVHAVCDETGLPRATVMRLAVREGVGSEALGML